MADFIDFVSKTRYVYGNKVRIGYKKMCDMVIIIVRNEMINQWINIDFSKINEQSSVFEQLTGKHWDRSNAPAMRYGKNYDILAEKGMMVSGSYHVVDNSHLLINNQIMKDISIPSREKITSQNIIMELGKNSWIKAKESKDYLPMSETSIDSDISIFSYLTKYADDMPRDVAKLMAERLKSPIFLHPNDQYEKKRLYHHLSADRDLNTLAGNGMFYLGTIRKSHAAIVRLSRMSAYISIIDNFRIDSFPSMTQNDYYVQLGKAHGYDIRVMLSASPPSKINCKNLIMAWTVGP